ncbi:MAG: hypothetical protein ACKVX7_13665 [Planctomycetota bacterium]
MSSEKPPALNDASLIYVGFNSRIAALHRATGALTWSWKARKGHGYVSLLQVGPQLFASVSGYTYCLDAATGGELWNNPLIGFGTGVSCLATETGSTAHFAALAEELLRAAQRAAST